MKSTFLHAVRTLALCLVLMIFMVPSANVRAEGEEAAITNSLVSQGIAVRSVSLSGTHVIVEYEQPISEMNTVLDVLSTVGAILSTVDSQLPSTDTGTIVQYFDDGQIMQIEGAPADGTAFANRQLSAEEFMALLSFRPLTRGPLLVPGECEPGQGETCVDYPECGCYPGERCDPSNPQADERGCVPGPAPANAHLVGSQYVCNDGYEWKADLSACVPIAQCPSNAFFFDGDCHCEPGYEWNAAGTECVPSQTNAGGTDNGDSGGGTSGLQDGVGSVLKALFDALVNWIKSLFG